MNKSISYIILLIAFPFYFTGCKKEVRPYGKLFLFDN